MIVNGDAYKFIRLVSTFWMHIFIGSIVKSKLAYSVPFYILHVHGIICIFYDL